ncbi:MAG: hypothetical protein ACREBC_01805 [Pyrinomonadaceae bacterium]
MIAPVTPADYFEYIRFDGGPCACVLSERGISPASISQLFLWKAGEGPPRLLPGISLANQQYSEREFTAAGISFAGIRTGAFCCPDPWTGEMIPATDVLTSRVQSSLPFGILPLFYRHWSPKGGVFWACVYGTYGRVTQLIIPAMNCVIYELWEHRARAVVTTLSETLALEGVRSKIEGRAEPMVAGAKRVGLLDMVTNFGHQLLNHLSGLQRLIDLDIGQRLDEIWVCGAEFFGPTEALFPEFEGRIKRVQSRWTVLEKLLREPCHVFKVGSNVATQPLRARVRRRGRSGPGDGFLRLVVTVRAEGRRCLNLPEAVAELYNSLLPEYPNLRIVLDGWVFPHSEVVAASSVATAISDRFAGRMRVEMALARAIVDRLPSGAAIANTIGRALAESLDDLEGAHAYFAHVGTLQHKLGLLVGIPGVVHGPSSQLRAPEGGPFSSQFGEPPTHLPPEAVEDVHAASDRGPGFDDYRIVDTSWAVHGLRRMLQQAVEHGSALQ